jgi:hypothetical protein
MTTLLECVEIHNQNAAAYHRVRMCSIQKTTAKSTLICAHPLRPDLFSFRDQFYFETRTLI